MSTDAIDAVSQSTMRDRLVGITDEIISARIRSSFSTIVRESGDLSVVVLDTEGNSIVQGSYSVPSFTGAAAATLRHMLAKFPPDSLEPGDVIATNDAWMGTGHLFDINVMRPVSRNGRIAGYTMSITHLPDIGGLGFGAAAERFVRRLLDTRRTEVFVSGSSAALLSREIASSLRGRAWPVLIHPFSFEEAAAIGESRFRSARTSCRVTNACVRNARSRTGSALAASPRRRVWVHRRAINCCGTTSTSRYCEMWWTGIA